MKRIILSALIVVHSSICLAQSQAASRKEIEPLITQIETLNELCRGGSGDEKRTQSACKQRDSLGTKAKNLGWCWGDQHSSQIEADKQWQMCDPIPGQPAEFRPVPRYDVAKTCDVISNASGSPSEIVRQGCFQQEQQSYNEIKKSWMKIPKTMQETCKSVAEASGTGSYIVLNGCIEQEMSAQDSNEKFEFKY